MNSFHHFLVYPGYWEYVPRFILKQTVGIIPAAKLILDLENLGKIEEEIFAVGSKDQSDDKISFLGSLSDILSNAFFYFFFLAKSEMLEDNKDDKLLINGLLQDIREMLAGGSDTSANTLAYLFYIINFY